MIMIIMEWRKEGWWSGSGVVVEWWWSGGGGVEEWKSGAVVE